nr:uncharacterized protein LOC125423168 [Ziziphus jujuba var. spinosa]
MYHTLKEYYWWGRDEKRVAGYVSKCFICQQMKGNWNGYLPLAEFTYNNSYHLSIEMSPYEALYGRQCQTPLCWNGTGERKLLGSKIIQVTVDKVNIIRTRLKAAQDRQKSYADVRKKDPEFEVGDRVFLKLSPWKGVVRFGK